MIAIIDAYGGNLASVQFAIDRLQKKSILTSDIDLISTASHVILPGVCNAKAAMNQLKNNHLINVIQQLKQPVLGICLGMQILYAFSEEGEVECLGLINDQIKVMPSKENYKIPHMGWNKLHIHQDHPLFKNVRHHGYVYFIHSYAASVEQHTLAFVQYGSMHYAAVVQKRNFYGMQFHPERSGQIGETLLKNFLNVA